MPENRPVSVRAIVISIILLCSVTPALATPSITGVSGTLAQGQAVTINGSAFGTKATSAPIRYDDFSSGTAGQTMYQYNSSWSDTTQDLTITTSNPRYTGHKSVSGFSANNSALGNGSNDTLCAWTSNGNINNIDFSSTKKFYVNYWYRMDEGTRPANYSAATSPSWQIKGLRLTNGSWTYPALFVDTFMRPYGVPTVTENYIDVRTVGATYDDALYSNTSPMTQTGWYNIVVQGKMDSAPLAGDASLTFMISSLNSSSVIDSITLSPTTLINGDYYSAVCLDTYIGNVGDPPAYNAGTVYTATSVVSYAGAYYKAKQSTTGNLPTDATYWESTLCGNVISNNHQYSNIYIDNSWARVELCDTSTWAARKHCEIQIPSAWSTTSATVTANIGSFSAGAAYLYVVDSDGVANANGYAVAVADAGAPRSRMTGRGSFSFR